MDRSKNQETATCPCNDADVKAFKATVRKTTTDKELYLQRSFSYVLFHKVVLINEVFLDC
jgi:hypothetical protein